MTTVDAPNVRNVAIEGTFDDCQDLVKALFADDAFRDEVQPRGHELDQLGPGGRPDPVLRPGGRRASGPSTWSCPSGNFGNILAGWYARQAGAPIERLVVASNSNDILARWVAPGRAGRRGGACRRLSPSMDIQVSSNHERLLFELLGRDGRRTAELFRRFRERRLRRGARRPRSSSPARPTDDDTLAEIRRPRPSTATSPTPTPPSACTSPGRSGWASSGPSCAWRRPTRPSSPTPSSGPRAPGRRCPSASPTCFDREERFDVLPADLDVVRGYVRDAFDGRRFLALPGTSRPAARRASRTTAAGGTRRRRWPGRGTGTRRRPPAASTCRCTSRRRRPPGSSRPERLDRGPLLVGHAQPVADDAVVLDLEAVAEDRRPAELAA